MSGNSYHSNKLRHGALLVLDTSAPQPVVEPEKPVKVSINERGEIVTEETKETAEEDPLDTELHKVPHWISLR